MAWQDQLDGDSLAWLLEPDDPGVRYLALRDLLDRPADDPELAAARQEAHERGPIATVLTAMMPEGCWAEPGPGYNPKYRSTVWSITLLAQLGARVEQDERIGRACAYLLDHALTPLGAVHRVRRAVRHGRLSPGQPVLGAHSSWAATMRDWRELSIGWRAPSPAKASLRTANATRRCATTPANVARCLPVDRTIRCRVPGAQPR